MEAELTRVRAKADEVQQQANGLVAHHVEDLTIDLNQQSNVDREPLYASKKQRIELQTANGVKQDTVRYTVNDIRSQADFLQGKISEYEILLMNYADEKSYLISEIERLRSTLAQENTTSEFEKVKGELLRGRTEILNEANDELANMSVDRW